MKRNKILSLLSLLLALPAVALALYLGTTGRYRPPELLRRDEQAREVADQLVACLDSGDFEGCGQYLWGDPQLLLPNPSGQEADALLWAFYRSNLSGELVGEPYLGDQSYIQDAVFFVPDLDGLTRRMKELAPKLVADRIAAAKDPRELYNADQSLREDLVLAVLRQAARKAMEERPEPMECRVRLELVYEKGQWKIQVNQDLLDILSGKMENG